MTIVNADTGEIIRPTSVHLAGEQLDKEAALLLTSRIRAYAKQLPLLVKQAHDGRAWKPLGYATWAEYVLAEFDMSKSQAYRLVRYAESLLEITDAAGLDAETSPMGDILPERVARELDLDAAKAAITEVVMDLPPEATTADRLAAVEATVDKLKAAAKAATRTPVPPAMAQDAAGANDADGMPHTPAPGSDATPAAEPDRAADPDPVPVSPETHRAAQRAETSRLIARHRPLLGMNVDDAIEAADREQLADLRAFTDSLADLVDELAHGLDRAMSVRSAS